MGDDIKRHNLDINNQGVGDDMAKDTKHLRYSNNSWHFDFLVPARLKNFFSVNRIRHSLNTSDYRQAKYLRDKYLVPALSARTALELLENILTSVNTAEIELDKSMHDLKAFLKRKDNPEDGVSLRKLCDMFMAAYGKGNFSDGSKRKLQSHVNAFCLIIGDETQAESIQKQDVITFRDTLLQMPVGWQKSSSGETVADAKCIHPNTAKKNLATLKRIFAWGMAEGHIRQHSNPADGVNVIGSGKEKHKRPPSVEEADKLCSLPVPKSSKFNKEAWSLLPVFARYTGCRIGEIAVLTVEDIIRKNGVTCLKITASGEGKRLKTEASERLVPVSDKLMPYILDLKKKIKKGSLFPACGHWLDAKGNIIKPAHYFLKAYNRATKKVAHDLSMHCFRAYANTQMTDAAVDILDREAILGHKSDRVQKAYTADNLQRWKAALDKIY
jgi:integrase